MRILYITEATGWTGGANQIWLTSQELVRRGHQIGVALRPEGDLAHRLQKANIPIFPLRIRQDYDLLSAFKLTQIARNFQAGLFHAHHPQSHAMGLLARHLGSPIPLIVTRRVIYPIRTNPFSAFKYRSQKISHYIAVCQKTAEELITAGIEKDRVSVIPSAVEMQRWNPLNSRHPKNHSPLVTLVAHYSPIKGHEIFLQAAAHVLESIPQTTFRLVGRDTEKLKEMARHLGILPHVEILGERLDIPELLSQTHLYVMPSLMEGIGTSLIEAQAARVPVIASHVGGLPDVVIPNETGILVPPGNSEALAKAIVRLLQNPKEAEQMAQKGYERVQKKFSLPAVVDQLEALYASVLGSKF
ncbi:MAG: glycosyltransferase family 4 protein [Elusimicrobia bacterium]|nr:glycosyltransferase family 4 protein [Elusimicrobiota bacterium]